MTENRETQVKSSLCDDASENIPIIIPKDIGHLTSPFDVTRKRKCYIKTDDGPPPVLKEVDCKKIVIFEDNE
jgi:hypothetical protein